MAAVEHFGIKRVEGSYEKNRNVQSRSRNGFWIRRWQFRGSIERGRVNEALEDHKGGGRTDRARESSSRDCEKRRDREREGSHCLVVRYRAARHKRHHRNPGRCENGKDRFDPD